MDLINNFVRYERVGMSNMQGQTYRETLMSQCPKFLLPTTCSPSSQPHSWALLDPPAQLWFSDPSPTSPPRFPHCSNSFRVSSTYTGKRFPVSLVTPGVQSQWKIEVCKVTSICHILADGIIHCRGQILHESLDCPTAIHGTIQDRSQPPLEGGNPPIPASWNDFSDCPHLPQKTVGRKGD